jgi:casein kinase 1
MLQGPANADRRRDRDHNRRGSQGPVNIVPPSPALVRRGSKQKVPAALTPGNPTTSAQYTPPSAAAQVNVPVGTGPRGSQHPYAIATEYDYNRKPDDSYGLQQQYGRASPMVSSVAAAPPAVANARPPAVPQEHGQQDIDEPSRKFSLIRFLTCRCG